jgi:signal transduction histidine kinase
MARSPVWRRLAPRLAFVLLVVAVGWGALVVAQGPGKFTTYAGHSALATALGIGAGLALTLAGLTVFIGRSSTLIGDLTLLAAFLWFAPIYVGWNGGPALVRSIAMLAATFAFPVLVHLVLAYLGSQLQEPISRNLARVAYTGAALIALGWALFTDPFYDPMCWANCNDNVFLLKSLPSLARAVETLGWWFSVGIAAAFAALCMWRLWAVSGPARRALLPVVAPGILVAASTATHGFAQLNIQLETPSETIFFGVFVVGCTALIGLSVGLVRGAFRTQLQRRSIARIVSSLDAAPPPGSLESALALAIGDPDLRITYPLSAQRLVDASGRSTAPPAAVAGRAVTTLVRDEHPVALVSHAAGLPAIGKELGPALRLALENERLQAESLAHVEDLRAARRRIIETSDAERRRMERDLHDGAQQRLLAVSYDIRLARAAAEAERDVQVFPLLGNAIDGAQAALDELRELAHGIYPAILEEAGLVPALASLADTAPVPVVVSGMPDERFPASIETAIYLLVADAIDDAAGRKATRVDVDADHDGEQLTIVIEDDGAERISSMIQTADRVGSLGGTLEVAPRVLRVEIPCA